MPRTHLQLSPSQNQALVFNGSVEDAFYWDLGHNMGLLYIRLGVSHVWGLGFRAGALKVWDSGFGDATCLTCLTGCQTAAQKKQP